MKAVVRSLLGFTAKWFTSALVVSCCLPPGLEAKQHASCESCFLFSTVYHRTCEHGFVCSCHLYFHRYQVFLQQDDCTELSDCSSAVQNCTSRGVYPHLCGHSSKASGKGWIVIYDSCSSNLALLFWMTVSIHFHGLMSTPIVLLPDAMRVTDNVEAVGMFRCWVHVQQM